MVFAESGQVLRNLLATLKSIGPPLLAAGLQRLTKIDELLCSVTEPVRPKKPIPAVWLRVRTVQEET